MQRSDGSAGPYRRLAAGVMAAVVAGCWAPAGVLAAGPASPAQIRGSVVKADGLTAVTGASVKAANVATGTIYASAPTGPDGVYQLAGLPAGSYDLAVEMPEGLYAADRLVEAEPGRASIVSLAIKPGVRAPQEGGEEKPEEEKKAEEEKKPEEGGQEEGKKEEPPEPQPTQKKRRKGAGFWRSPWGAATSIVVGSALVGAAANSAADDDKDEDPMTPSGGS